MSQEIYVTSYVPLSPVPLRFVGVSNGQKVDLPSLRAKPRREENIHNPTSRHNSSSRPQPAILEMRDTTESGDKFDLKKIIGQGGFGSVYEARRRASQERVVIKQMLRTPSKSSESMARREFHNSMKLKHPNLVRMRGSFDTDTAHCLVMDMVEGQNLFDHLSQQEFGGLEETTAKKMFRGLAKGMRFMHERAIAHLDIKLENIIIGRDGHLTVIDFGLSADANHICRQFCGSADYTPPEVLKRMPYQPIPSDVWSAGVVLFIMLTGGMPFGSGDVMHMRESPALPWPEEADISADAKELVQWMLELHPLARPTMKEVLHHQWLKKSMFQRILRN